MKLAHLILAHSEPEQLERLITRLSHPAATIYIHLDKKTNITSFEYLGKLENVVFIKKRVKVYWGSYSIVEATLNSLKEIKSTGNKYEYLNLLSGQDYPLKSQEDMHGYLSQHPGKAFMNYFLFEPDWAEAIPRIQEYHFNTIRIPGRYFLQRIVNKLLPKRKLPGHLIPVGRSQWFTISWECVIYLIDYWDCHANLRRFIKFTWAPDEFIFQTILYNSEYRNTMVNNDLRYIDWSTPGVSPKTLTMDDAGALMESGKFFARKFDLKKDAAVFNFVDRHLNV